MKQKKILCVAMCSAMLLLCFQPFCVGSVHAADTSTHAYCNHLGVYLSGEDYRWVKKDDNYHHEVYAQVTRCVNCNLEISRIDYLSGKEEVHHFRLDESTYSCVDCFYKK